MSNVKDIWIDAVLPWDWAGRLDDLDAAFCARLFLNPIVGVKLTQAEEGRHPTPQGGTMLMMRVTIQGKEAISWAALELLVEGLAGIEGGVILDAHALDIEDGGVPKALATHAWLHDGRGDAPRAHIS